MTVEAWTFLSVAILLLVANLVLSQQLHNLKEEIRFLATILQEACKDLEKYGSRNVRRVGPSEILAYFPEQPPAEMNHHVPPKETHL